MENSLYEDSSLVPIVKVIDFGLCAEIKGGETSRAFVGTVLYTAPEVTTEYLCGSSAAPSGGEWRVNEENWDVNARCSSCTRCLCFSVAGRTSADCEDRHFELKHLLQASTCSHF